MSVFEVVAEGWFVLLAGSTIILALGVGAMLLDGSLVRRKRVATTTLLVFFSWGALALVPLDRPLGKEGHKDPVPKWKEPAPVAVLTDPQPASIQVTSSPIPQPMEAAPTPAASIPHDEESSSGHVLAFILLLGASLSAAYLVLAWFVLRWRTRRSNPAPSEVFELATSLGISIKRLRIQVAAEPTRPFCYGLFKPTIVIPAELCRPDRRARLRAVLLHELSHIDGQDLRDQALLAVALPLLYWHPLFWMLRHHLRFSAEMLADERAAQAGDRQSYVRELIELVDHRQPNLPLAPALPVLGVESEFYRRMRMLLHRKRPLALDCSKTHTVVRRCAAVVVLGSVTLGWGVVALPAQDPGPQEKAAKPEAQKPASDTYRYEFSGTYPSPQHLEKLLIYVSKSGFSMTGLRMNKVEASSSGEFEAMLSRTINKTADVRQLMLDLLALRNTLHKAGITIRHLGPHRNGMTIVDGDRIKIANRLAAVLAVTKNRVSWTKTLDDLITVVVGGKDGRNADHSTWLTSLQLRGSRDARLGATLVAPGFVSGADIRKVANLYDDLGSSPIAPLLSAKSPPSGVKILDGNRDPSVSFAFSWKLTFKPPAHWIAPPGRPDGESAAISGAPSDLKAQYRELLAAACVLPRSRDLTQFMRHWQKYASSINISVDRFVPVRGSGGAKGLHRSSYQLYFKATTWQLLRMMSFVENQEQLYRIRDLTITAGDSGGGNQKHSCRFVFETFVLVPDKDLEARYGGARIDRKRLPKLYEFGGRNGRRDIFVDPRSVVAGKKK